MSHPVPSHESSNEYPEDGVTSYPHRRAKKARAKSHGPLHNVANRLNAKARALKQMISEPASKEWFEKHGLPKHLRKQ